MTNHSQIFSDVNCSDTDMMYSDVSIVDCEIFGKYLKKYHEFDLKSNLDDKTSVKFLCNGQMVASGTKVQIEMIKFYVKVFLSDLEIEQDFVQKSSSTPTNHRCNVDISVIYDIADNTHTIIELECDKRNADSFSRLHIDGVKLNGFLNEKLKLLVVHGDITGQQVDAIVNSSNERLEHIGGLATAIVQAGGQLIQIECTNYAQRKGRLECGGIYVSQPGKLPCKSIIHLVGPRWNGGDCGEALQLHDSVVNCLQEAESRKLSSLAIPAISTKMFGYPAYRAVPIIVQTIAEICNKLKYIQEIRLIDVDPSSIKLFVDNVSKLNGFRANNVESKKFEISVDGKIKENSLYFICGTKTNIDKARHMLDTVFNENIIGTS